MKGARTGVPQDCVGAQRGSNKHESIISVINIIIVVISIIVIIVSIGIFVIGVNITSIMK